MSAPAGASPAKRSVPVPPTKPKLGGTPPKAGINASSGSVPAGGPGVSMTAGSSGGNALWKNSAGSTPDLAHRRIASASPSVQTSTTTNQASPSSGGAPPTAPPKLAPKPPGRPKSGAFSVPATGPSNPGLSLPHLAPSASELKALAATYNVTNSELDSLQLLFLEMDTDNDGVISLTDLLKYKYASRRSTLPESSSDESESSEEAAQDSAIHIAFQPTTKGMVASSSAPRLVQVASGEDDENSDDSLESAKAMLKDMDLTESSEDTPSTSDIPSDSIAAPKQQGLSFRHIDFASLPQKPGQDSSDDDHLLADWDGPPEDDTKSTDSKSSKPKSGSGGSSPFGGLKKKFSKGALNLKSKLNGAGK